MNHFHCVPSDKLFSSFIIKDDITHTDDIIQTYNKLNVNTQV